MQVYEQLTGMQNVFNFDSGALEPFDVEGSVQNVAMRLSVHVGNDSNRYFALITTGMTIAAENSALGPNGLPMIAGNINREIASGDIAFLRDASGPASPGRLRATIRIYNTGGTDLFMALNEDTSLITLASAVSGNQFFIRSDTGESTTTPHTLNIGYVAPNCTGATPFLADDGLSCREIESAADCPGEFFNNAVSPARCDPIPTCDTTTTELNTGTNMCDCRTGFSGRVSPTMCETINTDCTGATPDLFNGVCVAACQPDEARNSAGVCEPNPANCGANAITNPDDNTNCVCIDDMHRFVAGSTTACEPISATCGANAINDPNDNTMCVCVDEMHRFVEGSTTMCEPNSEDNMEETEMENEMENEMEESQNTQLQPQPISEGKPKEFAYIGAGVFIIGFAASYISGGGFPIFTYSPDFGYSLTESGYSANVGGRADFRKDNWHLYYSANQQNANGNFADFRYTSGGRYNGDLFVATFSESVSGETADYNFSLSANLQNRIWKISPVYRLHSEYEKGETETQNELNLQGNFRYNRWTILPSAGFRWENANDFSENARFQINAIHRF